jgi:hypothetical protein
LLASIEDTTSPSTSELGFVISFGFAFDLGDQQQRDRGGSNASSMLSDLRDMLDTSAHSNSLLKASFLSAAAPDAGSSEDSIPC